MLYYFIIFLHIIYYFLIYNMKNNKKLWNNSEEISILEKLLEGLYKKQRELLKKNGGQGWRDYFLELFGY